MTLSGFLKAHLKVNKKSVKQLAEEIGISTVMLYYILNNKWPAGVKSLRKISQCFNLDIREVVKMNDRDKHLRASKSTGRDS